MLEVIVPATSSNIGPGYDCLGIALNLYNKFYFEKIDEGIIIEDNIVYQSMLYFLKMLNQVLFQKVLK